MIASLLAALLLSTPADAGPGQTPPPVQVTAVDQDQPTDLGDITVEGRRLRDMTEDFVREVGQPARGRGLARWKDGICVGVANLQPEAAQYIVDRVSTVAEDLGLKAGAPGCHPSVLIVATADGNAFAEEFVAMRPRLFAIGSAGTDLGYTALNRFKTAERPVRWWNVSMPTDSDTGDRAVRLPGDGGGSIFTYAPTIEVRGVSRLSTQIIDVSKRTFVIIDVSKISQVSVTQLADYVAMVSLAQINPDADTSGYATVLNLFDDAEHTTGLTDWDKAYLAGLYDAQRTRRNEASARGEIVASIVRVHHDLTAATDEDAPQ
ncbi:hypothetical protein [Brevundimonas goettingensis]|uniref:Uncharacterized protein n=1 Tax=Brevundimonas goettingensis TaxID=2774190 RepID=A0A975C3M8_9CAUL|nr:hypothetical protein [Brevundimonas goettingensis]QTC92489.1 hypothetical protein IFJ75_06335 [Brevundimonas goettingensis]